MHLDPPIAVKGYTGKEMTNFLRYDLKLQVANGSNISLVAKMQQHIPSFRNIKRKAYDNTEEWHSYVEEMLVWSNRFKGKMSPLFGIRCDTIFDEPEPNICEPIHKDSQRL